MNYVYTNVCCMLWEVIVWDLFKKPINILPTNSGVPCIVLTDIPGFNSLASPKSINLISQVSLLTQTIFSGYNNLKKYKYWTARRFYHHSFARLFPCMFNCLTFIYSVCLSVSYFFLSVSLFVFLLICPSVS